MTTKRVALGDGMFSPDLDPKAVKTVRSLRKKQTTIDRRVRLLLKDHYRLEQRIHRVNMRAIKGS